jgi:hypothetical protein
MAFDNVDMFNRLKIPHWLVVSKNNIHSLNGISRDSGAAIYRCGTPALVGSSLRTVVR